MTCPSLGRHGRPMIVALGLALALCMAGNAPVLAADGKAKAPELSLRLVPDDAAFYMALLRNREQIQAVANSRAWAKFTQIPVVQMGWSLYLMQAAVPNSLPARIQNALRDPQSRQSLEFLGDMLSQEVFVFGAADIIDVLELAQEVVNTVRYTPTLMEMTGESDPADRQKVRLRLLLEALAEDPARIKIPNLVLGFRIADQARAKEQLAQIEQIIRQGVESQPLLNNRLKHTKVGKHEFLTLNLDAKMIPWDLVPLDELRKLSDDQQSVDALLARVKKLKLVLALGLHGDYVLLALGPNTDLLAKLGQGPSLATAPELKPLKKLAQKRITSITYAAAEVAAWASSSSDVQSLASSVDELLEGVELPAKEKKQIHKDVEELLEDLESLMSEQGAMTEISFLTDDGYERYRYDWEGDDQLDGSAPLGLLEHLGGTPLCALLGRQQISVEDYATLAEWVPVMVDYFERYGMAEMSQADRQKATRLLKQIRPLGQRLDKANRNLLRALDGQAAFVLDAKLHSKRFLQALPATDKPLPMFEPALVFGLRDSALFRKTALEYRDLGERFLAALREVEPSTPLLELPKPKSAQSAAGEIHTYPLPQEWGLDKKIAVTTGLSAEVACLTISKAHADRLLTATPLKADKLLSTKTPLAAAFYWDCARSIEVLRPWAELAVQQIVHRQSPGDSDAAQARSAAILKQVDDFLSVLSVLRSINSASRFEDDTLVTHTKVILKDLEQ